MSLTMKFEEILEEVGSFGRFQKLLILLLVTPRIILPCHYLLNNFIAVVPPHHCNLSRPDSSELRRNLSEEQWLKVNIPTGADGGLETCRMFSEPRLQLLHNISSSTQVDRVHCQSGWEYERSTFTSTLVTEWDLVCDHKHLPQTTSTIFFLGVMLGAIVFGFLCDRYGRRRTLLLSYVLSMVFGFSSVFAGSYRTFAVLCFLTGFGLTGIDITTLVLSLEWVDSGHRSFIGVVASLAWSLGNMLLAGLAFLIRDWRPLIMAATAPLGVAILSWWWVPESARWLLANRKVEGARLYLDRCADANKQPRVSATLESLSDHQLLEHQDQNYTYLHLVKTPKMRRLTLLMGVVWYGVASTYYGISLNIGGFGLNLFLTHFIYAAVGVPAKVIVLFLLDVIGRKKCQAGSLVLTGTCIALNLLVPKDLWLLRSLVAILGKGLSEASFTTVLLYTAEIFPTVVRQNALGYSNFVSRVGVSVAPLVLLLEEVWPPLSQIIICTVAVVSGLTSLLLPETLDARLPETIDDIEGHRGGR